MKVLVLDNHDSFTANLVHCIEVAGGRCTVLRSDAASLPAIRELNPARIVFSPGPFGPDRTGICPAVLGEFSGRIPILGVCLGMQLIAWAHGARIVPSGKPIHGKTSWVHHAGSPLYAGIPDPFEAARYHSLIVEPASMPAHLEISAWTPEGTILGCRIPGQDVEGVMFHPESFLTPHGPAIVANFLRSTPLVVG